MDHTTIPATAPARYSLLFWGAVLGGLAMLPVVALQFLAAQGMGLPFFPFDLFDWLARVLPGGLVIASIDTMVRVIQFLGVGSISDTAKSVEQTMGILMVIGGGAVGGLAIASGVRTGRWPHARSVGAAVGALAFLVATGIELSLKSAANDGMLLGLFWLAALFAGWGLLLGGWLAALAGAPPRAPAAAGFDAARRVLLFKLAGGSIGLAVVATGLGRLIMADKANSGAGQPLANVPLALPSGAITPSAAPTLAPATQSPSAIATPPPGTMAPSATATLLPDATAVATMRDRVAAVPGVRPELTPADSFYRIDINASPVSINQGSWKLEVTGLFDRPHALTLADLRAYPAVTQAITQSCISNPIGGDLIGTVNYTGVRLRDVLQDLGLRPQAKALAVRAADGFYESVGMQDLMDPRTLLVYGLNGTTLSTEHGFPLRVYIPNRYGMKQPKWITAIEAIDHDGPGYWVERGWSPTAHPQIISVIDAVAEDRIADDRVPVGGIAWAGDRGIQRVEVQVDQGDWVPAVLRTPSLSPLTWVQWRYDWPVVKGTHTFRVRATDGAGVRQTATVADTYPDGATGYDTMTVTL